MVRPGLFSILRHGGYLRALLDFAMRLARKPTTLQIITFRKDAPAVVVSCVKDIEADLITESPAVPNRLRFRRNLA